MSTRTLCAHLFGLVALAAALLVLPQGAHAHAGHAHALQAHTMPQPQADAPAPADRAGEEETVQSLTAAEHDAPGEDPGSPRPDCCCCAQGSCAAGFSIVAPMPPQVAPPSRGTTFMLIVSPLPPGVGGPSLRRPPRSFA